MATKKKEESSSKKGKAKLVSRQKEKAVSHNGIMFLMIDMSEEEKHCGQCSIKLPKKGMVVTFDNDLYCGFDCSDKIKHDPRI